MASSTGLKLSIDLAIAADPERELARLGALGPPLTGRQAAWMPFSAKAGVAAAAPAPASSC